MKKVTLMAIALFFFTIVNAQLKRSKDYLNGGSDTTWHNQTEPLKRAKTPNGDILMKQESGKFKLYASYSKGKVTDWYAIDTKGNKIPATYTAKGAAGCWVCAVLPTPPPHCYQISCDDLPKPKTDAVKTAH